MDNIKKHKIFDDDAVVVEKVEAEKKPIINRPSMAEKRDTKTVMVEDVIDSFAGYLPNRISFNTPGDGTCVLCGSTTISPMRKVCFDCMEKNGEKLYKEAKKAVNKGESSFMF